MAWFIYKNHCIQAELLCVWSHLYYHSYEMFIFLDQLELIRQFWAIKNLVSQDDLDREWFFWWGLNQMHQCLSLDWAIILNRCGRRMSLWEMVLPSSEDLLPAHFLSSGSHPCWDVQPQGLGEVRLVPGGRGTSDKCSRATLGTRTTKKIVQISEGWTKGWISNIRTRSFEGQSGSVYQK